MDAAVTRARSPLVSSCCQKQRGSGGIVAGKRMAVDMELARRRLRLGTVTNLRCRSPSQREEPSQMWAPPNRMELLEALVTDDPRLTGVPTDVDDPLCRSGAS